MPYLEKLGLFETNEYWFLLSKWGFIFLVMFFGTSILFYFGTPEGKESRFFSVGSIFTTLLFGLTSYLFGVYIENFSRYNQLYGSIGALLIFLLYIWLNSNILLLGFELNATLRQLKRSKGGVAPEGSEMI